MTKSIGDLLFLLFSICLWSLLTALSFTEGTHFYIKPKKNINQDDDESKEFLFRQVYLQYETDLVFLVKLPFLGFL